MIPRLSFGGPDFRSGGDALLAAMDVAHQAGVIEVTQGMLAEQRDDVIGAGLGGRLANAWRSQVYPRRGASMEATGIVYINAGKRRGPFRGLASAVRIIDRFSSGRPLTPITGEALAIPTQNVPFARGSRGTRRRMTPIEVEAYFNVELVPVRLKTGKIGLFAPAVKSRNGRGFKPVTPGRAAQGRRSVSVMMFTLVRDVAGQKRLDPDQIARVWVARLPAAIDAHQRLGK